MAKIGTAQIEIKPVLNEEALDALCARVEQRVREAVARGMEVAPVPSGGYRVTCSTTGPVKVS